MKAESLTHLARLWELKLVNHVHGLRRNVPMLSRCCIMFLYSVVSKKTGDIIVADS